MSTNGFNSHKAWERYNQIANNESTYNQVQSFLKRQPSTISKTEIKRRLAKYLGGGQYDPTSTDPVVIASTAMWLEVADTFVDE